MIMPQFIVNKPKKVNKVMLIFPPSSHNGVGMEDSFIPNGLLSIAGYLKIHLPKLEIKVIDGSVTSLTKIKYQINEFSPDIIGLSVLLGNYSNAKTILIEAKKNKAITILGNHHAKYLIDLVSKNALFEIPNVDYLVKGKRGENTFLKLIQSIEEGKGFENISQLAYKQNNNYFFNNDEIDYPKIKDRVDPDLTFISDFSEYSQAYNKIFGNFHNKDIRPININFIEGCHQGCVEPCIYCCLKDHQIDYLSPELYWGKITQLVEMGFNYIFETCNSLSSLQYERYNGSNYLESLAKSIPHSLKGKFNMMVYARANEINNTSLQAFKDIGVNRVIFGFDSGDNSVLKTGINKLGVYAISNINAAKLLNEENIQIYACYVPGSINETAQSLENTYLQIKELLKLKNTSVIEFTSLAPMPGSKAWNIIENDFNTKYEISDQINVSLLAKYWVDNKVKGVSWDLIQDYKTKIKTLTIKNNKIFGGYY